MNGAISDVKLFAEKFNALSKEDVNRTRNIEIAICPPTPYTAYMANIMPGFVSVGAQNCDALGGDNADFNNTKVKKCTGEVSPKILKDAGCKYCIVGHSERRSFESRAEVLEKVNGLVRAGVTPIICIGDSTADDDIACLEKEISKISEICDGRVVLAYEPIWMIGQDMDEDFIPKLINKISYVRSVFKGTLIYGGGVDSKISESIVHGVDGLLIGRASLDFADFCNIMKRCCEVKYRGT